MSAYFVRGSQRELLGFGSGIRVFPLVRRRTSGAVGDAVGFFGSGDAGDDEFSEKAEGEELCSEEDGGDGVGKEGTVSDWLAGEPGNARDQ